MAAPRWPSISSSLDATIASLDALHQADRDRSRETLRSLESVVGQLGIPSGFDDEDDRASAGPLERRDERSAGSAPSPDPAPFVALPQRTTHGGPWGPKMREKLTAIALGKRGW